MANQDLLNALFRPPKRRVFVSYHHAGDQQYYNAFSRAFHDGYEAIQDNSLDREIDSEATDYVMRRIREDYISGTSCTLVLCGAQTRWRKYVDWEIKATLDKGHGLIGVNLPTNPADSRGMVHVPDRLQDNVASGYAVWAQWHEITASPVALQHYIEIANSRSAALIRNGRELRKRSG